MLMLKIQNGLIRDPFDFNRDATTAKVIGLSQTVPVFGKRDLQRQGALREAEADRWRIEERRIELRRMVKETWYRISAVDRSLEILEKNITALDDLLRFSETMYGVGQGLQQDVLKAQLERSKMEEMRISLQQQRRSLTATLNTLRLSPGGHRSAGHPADRHRPPAAGADQLLKHWPRPIVPPSRHCAAQIEKAQVNRKLADKEFYPDFTLSFEYMQIESGLESEGDDMYSASVSFNLPVQRQRRHAMVAEAGAENRMLLAERDMLRNQIRLAVADSLAALDGKRQTDPSL